jgi:GntR family transcriptional regulator
MNSHRFNVRPLFLQVRDAVADRISSGIWKANAVLPNELVLAQEFGVSQGTVRKALDTLEAEKIVTRKQGQGTFVVDHATEEMAIRFSNLYDDNGNRIAGTIGWQQTEKAKATPSECKHLDVMPEDDVFRCKRTRVHNNATFFYEEATIPSRRMPKLNIDDLDSYRITPLAQLHGVSLRHAREKVTIVMATPDIAHHLDVEISTPIFMLDRIIVSLANDPIEWRVAWGHLRDMHFIAVSR